MGLPLGAGARWGYPQRSGARLNRIHGVRQDGTEVFFKIKRKSPLKKLMDVYAQRQGGTTNAYRFIFDGNRIVETQTPDDVRNPACHRHPFGYRRVHESSTRSSGR